MRIEENIDFGSLIDLKDELWLKRQKHAGRCVAACLKDCGEAIKNESKLSLLDLENIVKKQIKAFDCEPTFLNYKGFPAWACISVNHALVHGIPSDYMLQSGDLISVDLGATYEGAIADAARTWIYGEPKTQEHVRLIKTCWNALQAGIKAIEIGKRVGVIGNAIFKSVKDSGFQVITNYGGHGLTYNTPHSVPFIANKSTINEGPRIQHGLSIAVEPMLVIGEAKTKVAEDKWTVMTPGIGCHFENSVTIMPDGIHIITEIPYEKY